MDAANKLLQQAMELSKQLDRMQDKVVAREGSVDMMKRELKQFADSSTFIVHNTKELEFLRNIVDEKPVAITIPASTSNEEAHQMMHKTWSGVLVNKQT